MEIDQKKHDFLSFFMLFCILGLLGPSASRGELFDELSSFLSSSLWAAIRPSVLKTDR
jgi:hypothetical protein